MTTFSTVIRMRKMSKFKRIAEVALEKSRLEKLLRAQQQFASDFDKTRNEEYNNHLELSSDQMSLQFKPGYFEAKRAKMLPSRCHEALQKLPIHRTINDIKTLRSYMVGLKSFELYSPKMQMALCRVVRHESFGKGRVIVRKGAPGSSMYFISYGKVGIAHDQDGEMCFTQADPITISRGGCFGEVALANKTTRTATVVVMEYTELLVIDKEDFNELNLEKYVYSEQQGREKCFGSIDAFAGFSNAEINHLVKNSKTESYTINTIIKADTDRSDQSYFVIKGTIEIYRVVTLKDIDKYVARLDQKYHGRTYKHAVHTQNHNLLVKVGAYHGNSYFTVDVNDTRNYTIISLGAAVSRLKNDFLRDLNVLSDLIEHQSNICDDDEIVKQFLIQNEWNFFKKEFIKHEVDKIKPKQYRSRPRPKTAQAELGVINATSRKKQSTFIHAIDMPIFHTQTFHNQFL